MAVRRNIRFRDRRDSSRLNNLIENRLNERLSKPLIKAPKAPKEESTKISEIIKQPEEIVKTGKVLEDNKVIDSNDKASTKELIDLVKPISTIDDGNAESIINAIKNPKVAEIIADPVPDTKDFNEEDRRRILIEEKERRAIEDERFRKIQEAFNDEIERRETFKKELEQMKLEFDLYLKEKYPEIVGEKNIKDSDIEKRKEEVKQKAKEVKERKEKLKLNMVKRVEGEKIRKQKEIKMVTSTKTARNVSTFLEEEIIIEQQEKKDRNPEIDGLNEVQKIIKEANEMEIRMGRPIVPHRDIVESNESDFDSDTSSKSTDLLIKPKQESPFENYEQKREVLEVLRQSMNNRNGEDDFIVKMDKDDRKRGR
jgi:hypothetical protein